jgi:hypothetical protein
MRYMWRGWVIVDYDPVRALYAPDGSFVMDEDDLIGVITPGVFESLAYEAVRREERAK